MKLDKTDLEIVKHLWDGRKPFADIAQEMGITTNTVRARVNRLTDEGILQIIGLVDPFAIPGHSAAFIGYKVEAKSINKVRDELQKLKGVVGVACVSGRFDLLSMMMFNQEYSYKDFIYEELPKIEGLVSFETFFVVEATEFNLRYVL
jgi:Lrp/AsnC family transcriptional regulator for asnA, asnC and gidA